MYSKAPNDQKLEAKKKTPKNEFLNVFSPFPHSVVPPIFCLSSLPTSPPLPSFVIFILSCTDMMKQSLSLARKPHVVIATPGRLADHLRSTDTVSLKKIKFLVRLTAYKTVQGVSLIPSPLLQLLRAHKNEQLELIHSCYLHTRSPQAAEAWAH